MLSNYKLCTLNWVHCYKVYLEKNFTFKDEEENLLIVTKITVKARKTKYEGGQWSNQENVGDIFIDQTEKQNHSRHGHA